MEYFLIVMMTLSSYVRSSPFDELISTDQSPVGADEDGPWKNPYLPTTIIPTLYELFLFPNFYFDELNFEGHITIYFRVLIETNTIIVHMRDLHITSTIVIGCQSENVPINRTFEYKRNAYWVTQTATLLPNASCTARLKLVFNGNLTMPDNETEKFTTGFYKGTYINAITGEKSWYVATELQPSNSRLVFPNFDEPRFKVEFEVKLRHWRNFTALSNMLEIKKDDIESIWRDTTFKKSPQMSSYLANFIISDCTSKNNTLVGGQMHRVWVRPDRINQVDYALNVTPLIEDYLHQELQLPYRLEKLDQFAVPQLPSSGAMESWGLIVYRGSTILFDVTKEEEIAKAPVLSIIAHELSHNYFGNPVTCRDWNHIWLNEGMARFYQHKALKAIGPALFKEELYFALKLEEIMDGDAKTSTRPVVLNLTLPHRERRHIHSIVYDKGAAILRMVEYSLRADVFRRGIRHYLRRHENKTVVTEDLWKALEEVFPGRINLNNLMRTWIYEKGFPVVTVELINSGNRLNVTQKRFLIDPLAVSNKEYKWNIPLSCRTNREPCSKWMTDNHAIFNNPMRSNDDWIQFNYDMSGYYRVNYDANLWNRLVKQLNRNHMIFSEVGRLKLLSDALSMVKAEQLGYDTFLDLTRYATKERQLTPWIFIYDGLLVISNMVSDTEYSSLYKRYLLNLTSPLMDQLQVKDEGSHIEKRLRSKIIPMSCSGGHRGCLENTTRLFRAWIQNDTMNAIPYNLRREVYCRGIANSFLESEWNTVFERFTMPKYDEDRFYLSHALSCSKNATLLKRLVELYINGNRDLFIEGAVYKAVRNPASENFAWLRLRNISIHDKSFSALLEPAVDNFKTREQRQELLDLLGNSTSVKASKRERIFGNIDKKIRWMDRNLATVVSWFERNDPIQSG